MNKNIEIKCTLDYEGNSNCDFIRGPKFKKYLTIEDALYIIENILLLDSSFIENNYKEKWEEFKYEFDCWEDLLIEELMCFIEGDINIDVYCLDAGISYEEDFPPLIYLGVSLLKFLQDKEYI